MIRYLIFGLVIIACFLTLLIPIRHSRTEKGIVIFNEDKSQIYFVPIEKANYGICNGDLELMEDLKGFQFKQTGGNRGQFLDTECKVFTSKPGKDYGISARIWYFNKCVGKFSYKESLFSNIMLQLDYRDFSIEVDGKIFINFKYIIRLNIDSVKLEEIK